MTLYRCPSISSNSLTKSAGASYAPFGAGLASATFIYNTDAQAAIKMRGSGYITNLRCYVSANAHTAGMTVTLYKNGSATSCAFTITSATTGHFEDTANYVAFADGDVLSIEVNGLGTGNVSLTYYGADIMAATAFSKPICSQTTSFSTASATRYAKPVGLLTNSVTTLDNTIQQTVPCSCTAKNLSVYIATNGRSTNTTVEILKNGTGTGVIATITGSGTGYFDDTTNTASFSAGDKVALAIVTGTGTGACSFRTISFDLEGPSGASVPIITAYSGSGVASGATRYLSGLGAYGSGQTSETPTQVVLRGTGTIQNLWSQIAANTATNSSVLTMRKNAADQTLTLTVAATTTGQFSDVTHSFTYADGDLIAQKWSRGGASSGTLTFGQMALELVPDAESFPPAASFNPAWAKNSNTILMGGRV